MIYSYEVAEEKDESELRHFIASMPMPGDISIRLERNPNYFSASAVEGSFSETLIVRAEDNSITGLGNRAEKAAFINGLKTTLGYLSGLRVAKSHRSLKYLTKAYRQLQQLHEKGKTPFYLTTIVDENERATKVLESGRGSLPKYQYLGQYLTCVVPPKKIHGSCFDIRTAKKRDLPELIQFLNREGSKKQFFPVYSEDDFNNGLLKGLNFSSIYLALDEEGICGCMGVWDQHRYKQLVIDGYSTSMKWTRPFYNLQATLRRRPRLPAAGKPLNSLKVAIPWAKGDQKDILYSLLECCSIHATKQKKALLFGLHENDSFARFVSALGGRIYNSRLYVVHWPDGKDDAEKINRDKVPYLELGGL